MPRYIDADALLKAVKSSMESGTLYLPIEFRELIEEAPTVDVGRPKGKWLRDPPEGGYALYKCSVCGKCWPYWYASAMTAEKMANEVKCCPNCEADMREETPDEKTIPQS